MIPSSIVPAKAVEMAAVVGDGVIFDLGGRSRRRRDAAAVAVGVGKVGNLGPTHDEE